MSRSRISLKDVAAEAGVHYSTVSLALSDSPKLPRATRKRIRVIAEKMGYRPDAALSALNAYREVNRNAKYHATLAVVSDDPVWYRRRTRGAAQYRGMQHQAERQGYLVEPFAIEPNASGQSVLSRMLHARNITGVLFAPMKRPHTSIDLPCGDYSCVASGYSLELPDFHRVLSAHFRNGMRCLEQLHGRGYRRIGCALPGSANERVGSRYGAAYDTFCRHHPDVTPLPFFSPEDHEREYAPKKAIAWIRQHRIDAIFHAHGRDFLQWLPALGLRIPKDLGVVTARAPDRNGPQTGIFEGDELIGRTMVNQMVAMMHRDERGLPETAMQTLVSGEWIEGSTVRKRE